MNLAVCFFPFLWPITPISHAAVFLCLYLGRFLNSRPDDRRLDFEAEVAPRAGLSFLAGAGDSACDEEQKGEDEAIADKMAWM